MTQGLNSLDYTIVVAYLILIAGIGISFYRRESTPKDYFLGGRSVRWVPIGISIIASDLSAITVMGLPAWGFKHNLELLWISIGRPLTAPLIILIFVPFYASLKLYTAYDYLERRFDLSVRLVTSGLFQILRSTHIAIALYAPSIVISLVTGLPIWQCILFMGAVTTIYTTLGGMKAVIWTDVIQFCMVMSGIVLIFYKALSHLDGGFLQAFKIAQAAGHLKFLNLSLDPKQLTSLWACLIGGCFFNFAPLATDQVFIQRLFATKSLEDCKRSVILQAILAFPVSVLLYLAGTALFVFYYYYPARLHGLTSNDAIMPFFALHELPHGVSGLIIASIFAASMAVMSAGLNSLTTAFTVDIYYRIIRPNQTAASYATVGRLGTLGWGVVVSILALYASRLGDLVLAYSRVSSVISGPMVGIFLLGTLAKRATAMGTLIGALGGMIAVMATSALTDWSFFYLGPIGMTATFTFGLVASLFMRPSSPEKLDGLVVGRGKLNSAVATEMN